MKQPNQQTISFFGSVGAGANVTLVSKLLSSKFKTKIVRASFAPGVNRLMTLKFFISPDDNNPTTEEPTGTNIFSTIGQVPYLTGDDEVKTLPHEVLQTERNSFLKVYAENGDTFSHTIDAQITIEFLEENDNAEN